MSYHAKITSKGQITLPADLRARMQVSVGDTLEFYLDHLDQVRVRARYAGVDRVLSALSSRKPDPRYPTDEDAIAATVLARDARSRRKSKVPSK